MNKKQLTIALIVLTAFLFGLPGLMGFLAKQHIERAVYLSNLNTALDFEILNYQQNWFSSSFQIASSIEDEFEESNTDLGTYDFSLKHGPITFINNQPGVGAFYIFSNTPQKTHSQDASPLHFIAHARAGFLGNIQLNLNLNIPEQSSTHASNSTADFLPMIISVDSDSEFNQINFRLHWQGTNPKHHSNNKVKIENISLLSRLSRQDDEHWQGESILSIQDLSVPSTPIDLKNLRLKVTNSISIEESNRATNLTIEAESRVLKTPWNHWENLTLNALIQDADLNAMISLYDLIQRAYFEFDSAFDEYAQLEYMTTIQTLTPELLSDNATVKFKALSYYSTQEKQIKNITGEIFFPDLPEYMDDHLISLISQTSGDIELRTNNEKEDIRINKGKITLNNEPLDLSIFN